MVKDEKRREKRGGESIYFGEQYLFDAVLNKDYIKNQYV